MVSNETWEIFGNLLEQRLAKNVFTTEDSVRYTFFAALLERERLRPEDIVLESPHPTVAGARVDVWIPPLGVAAEFKYDREIPSGKNSPMTQKAGKVFHDLYRLGRAGTAPNRLLVYLASNEMASYFRNKRNGLTEFFLLPLGHSLRIDEAFLSRRPTTFISTAKAVPNVEILTLYLRSLPSGHELRTYEVRNIPVDS